MIRVPTKFIFLPVLVLSIICSFVSTTSWARSPGQDAYDKGSAAYQTSDYFAAAASFHKATVLDPGMLKAWEGLGWAWRKLGRNDDAIRIWNTLLKIEPDHSEILSEIASIHSERREYKTAISFYKKSLSHNSNQPKLHLRIGDLYQDMNKVDAAVAEYRRAARDKNLRTKAYNRIASLYESVGQKDRAVAFIEQLVETGRASNKLKGRLARLYADEAKAAYDRKDYEKSIQQYQQAIEQNVDVASYYASLGWVYRKRGELVKAIVVWKEALKANPELENLNVAIADAYRDSGDLDSAERWYRQAFVNSENSIAIFRMIETALKNDEQLGASWWANILIESDVTRASWINRLAQLYIDTGHADWGLNYFAQESKTLLGVEHGEAVALLYVAQGDMHFNKANYIVAEAYYAQALELDPYNWSALRDLGWTYWHRQRWSDCAAVWERLIKLDSSAYEPHNLFTQFYMERGSYRMAVAHAKRSIELYPDQPDQKLRMARAYYLNEQYSEARAMAAELAAAHPGHFNIQKFQAELHSRYREHEAAKKQWAIVLKLDPSSVRAKKKWLFSRYELGEYEEALAGLKAVLKEDGPDERIYKLLAENSLALDNYGEAALWYEQLVEHYPERVRYWLSLARIYTEDQRLHFAQNVLVRAGWYFLENVDVMQALANNYSASGKMDEALVVFRLIQENNPNHRPSFVGMVSALINLAEYEEALAKVESPKALRFWKDYEIELMRATVYDAMRYQGKASRLRDNVVSVGGDSSYIPILLYHGISANPRDKETIHVNLLESQIYTLKEAGYTTITMSEFSQMMAGELEFPDKPILITFDDARRDSFVMADPLLEKYGMKATMFVSTAEIVDEHPFHLDWPGMREYKKTERWDFQSHGHNAHKRISIDAEGNQGSFLVNRKWLAEKERLETEDEYRQRLNDDYKASIRYLKREVGGKHLDVYAYPYSEAGQQHVGNAPFAYELNTELLQDYFPFGAVQDQSGYNLISDGKTSSPLLRRFNVPHSMKGNELLEHLRYRQPQNMSHLAIAQSLYWQNQYEAAGEMFDELDENDLAPKDKTQFFLGGIDYQRGNYKEASDHFFEAIEASDGEHPSATKLYRKTQWLVRPTLAMNAEQRHDSNDRTTTLLEAKYQQPVSNPMDVWLAVGNTLLEEEGFEELDTSHYDLGFSWRKSQQLLFSASLRSRSGGDVSTSSYKLSTSYHSAGLRLSIQLAKEDVNTLQAYLNELQFDRLVTNITIPMSQNWSTQLVLDYRDYSDDNSRGDARMALIYGLPQYDHWRVLLQHAYRDAETDSAIYYTPTELNITELVFRYRHPLVSDWAIESELGVGYAAGDNHADRKTYQASAEAQRNWGDNFRASARMSYQNTTTYDSWSVGLSADYLF